MDALVMAPKKCNLDALGAVTYSCQHFNTNTKIQNYFACSKKKKACALTYLLNIMDN